MMGGCIGFDGLTLMDWRGRRKRRRSSTSSSTGRSSSSTSSTSRGQSRNEVEFAIDRVCTGAEAIELETVMDLGLFPSVLPSHNSLHG